MTHDKGLKKREMTVTKLEDSDEIWVMSSCVTCRRVKGALENMMGFRRLPNGMMFDCPNRR
jgi:hypothetical protein